MAEKEGDKRARRLLKPFIDRESIDIKETEQIAQDAGFQPGAWGGYLNGKGCLERNGDQISITEVGIHEYVRLRRKLTASGK